MTTCYDSVTARDIPSDAEMVAGYVSGRYAWSEADWARFPNARKVRIVTAAHLLDGDVLDVEKGDATPAQAPGWIKARLASGYHRPTIYCPKTDRAAVETACRDAGYTRGIHYDLWIAHYRTNASTPPWQEPGAVATQYANADTSGGHFDLSLVTDPGWPYRTPSGDSGDMTPEEHGWLYDIHAVIAKQYIEKIVQWTQAHADNPNTGGGVGQIDYDKLADDLAQHMADDLAARLKA